MKGGVKMLEHKENKELTEAEVNAYDLVIICYGKLRKDCLTDCLDGTYLVITRAVRCARKNPFSKSEFGFENGIFS